MGLNLMNQRFNESKIENIPVFFSNLRQVKYLQAYLRDIRSLWLHSWLIAICLCEIDWLGRWRPRCAKRHARAHMRRRHWVTDETYTDVELPLKPLLFHVLISRPYDVFHARRHNTRKLLWQVSWEILIRK